MALTRHIARTIPTAESIDNVIMISANLAVIVVMLAGTMLTGDRRIPEVQIPEAGSSCNVTNSEIRCA